MILPSFDYVMFNLAYAKKLRPKSVTKTLFSPLCFSIPISLPIIILWGWIFYGFFIALRTVNGFCR